MYPDYFLNGQGFGEVGGELGRLNFDPGMYRPYFNDNGVACVTIKKKPGLTYDDKHRRYVPINTREEHEVRISDLMANGENLGVWNATTLRKEDWLLFDRAVKKATRQRLSGWNDLVSRAGVYNVNGMGKMILEHETMNDPQKAKVDMFGESEGEDDKHLFQLEGLPLPITHSGWHFWKRHLQISRNSPGFSLDTLRAEAAGFRIGEMTEKILIGTETGLAYGGASTHVGGYGRTSQVYGYTNFTNRNTKTDVTTPTGANPNATVDDVLEMREQMYQDGFFGPFIIYHSTDWDRWMDSDYAFVNSTGWAVNPNMTLRQRLKAIDGIADVKRLDYLTASANPYTFIMVQMSQNVCRAVNGMDLQVLQWEEKGGQKLLFKAMCIYVPQLFADYNGNCGILQATTS